MTLFYILRSRNIQTLATMSAQLNDTNKPPHARHWSRRPKANNYIYNLLLHPLPSNRQHLSYDVCLEVRGEIIRTVLCCIVY